MKFFSTREERDVALAEQREGAIARGLSRSAAWAGIYPVELSKDMLSKDLLDAGVGLQQWLEWYRDYEARPSDQARMLDELGL